MRSCIITFNIHNICFVGWCDSLLVLFVICSNYAFPLIKKKKHKTDKKTSNADSCVIISIVCDRTNWQNVWNSVLFGLCLNISVLIDCGSYALAG